MSESNTPSDGAVTPPVDAGQLPWTPRAKAVLNAACRQAREEGFTQAGTQHVLLGMLSVKKCLGAVILERLDVSEQKCRQCYEQLRRSPEEPGSGEVTLAPEVDKVTRCAREQAIQWGHTYLGAEHLLAGLLAAHQGIGFQILTDLGVTLDRVRQEIAKLIVCRSAASE